MNTPLRDEIREILFKAAGGISDMANEEIDQILNLLASKMPEKEEELQIDFTNMQTIVKAWERKGWNAYHDTFKSILKGGTDE
jgi:hypothetical protein